MRHNGSLYTAFKTILQHLHPAFVLTDRLWPRLLLLAPLADGGFVFFGILYHTQKQAFQPRLRFLYRDGRSEALLASTWMRCADEQTFLQHKDQIVQSFAVLAASLGGEMVTLEFAPGASNREVEAALFASEILSLLYTWLSGSR
jgi:hypothetical protein